MISAMRVGMLQDRQQLKAALAENVEALQSLSVPWFKDAETRAVR